MIHAFVCRTCDVKIYSAAAARDRGCPLCGATMEQADRSPRLAAVRRAREQLSGRAEPRGAAPSTH